MDTEATIDRIRALMDRHAMNQTQAAAYLGVPTGTLGNWLQGTRTPTSATVRLLEVMGMMEAFAPALHARLLPSKGE